jgi:hypothetical protein
MLVVGLLTFCVGRVEEDVAVADSAAAFLCQLCSW